MSQNIQSWQEAIKERMDSRHWKWWALPKVVYDVSRIINEHSPQSYSPISNQAKTDIDTDMNEFFTAFIQRIKKYTKRELTETEATELYEAFVINYEEIWLLLKNNTLGKRADWWRFSQLWNSDFITKYFFSSQFLAQQLEISESDVKELFTKRLKLRFAVWNISNPLEALKRVKKHLDTTLSDVNIAQQLEISESDVKELFTKRLKLYFAVWNISNPLKWIYKWKKGEITTPWGTYPR